MGYLTVKLNTHRNIIRGLSEPQRSQEARTCTENCIERRTGHHARASASADAIARYLAIEPPVLSIVPEFQTIIDEIEDAYVLGLDFAAVASACVTVERLLNHARIALHPHCKPVIKKLWGKDEITAWEDNIAALEKWGYLKDGFGDELRTLYQDVRNPYLHSQPIRNLQADSLRAVTAAYRLLNLFLGLPEDLFELTANGIKCRDENDPRFIAFYRDHLRPG